MKRLSLIVLFLVFVLSFSNAWAKDDIFDASIGISVWNPVITTTPAYSSSLLVGPEVSFMLSGFFADITYLLPISGYEFTQNLDGVTVTSKLSWLNIVMGLMLSKNIGIFGGYLNNYQTVSIPGISAFTSTIKGPEAGFVLSFPIFKVLDIYSDASYTFGSYSDNLGGSYKCSVYNIEGGLGIIFLTNAHLTIGYRYQLDTFTNAPSSNNQTFSGPYGVLTYRFGF